jgi:hypothetical protein
MPKPVPLRLASLMFAATVLTVALLAVLPAAVSAQPPPPHLFAGQVADVTINGAPWDGSLIEIIDSNGVRVATVDRVDDGWSAFVPPTAGTVRFRLGDATSQAFTISPGHLTQIALTLVDGGAGRAVALVSGFNFVVWTGVTMSVDDALATFPNIDQIAAVFEFDASTQAWRSVRPGAAAFLQGFTDMVAGRVYVFSMTGSVAWTMPTDGALGGTVTVATGFTTIGWIGPAGVPQDILDAAANAGAVVVIFRFNAGTQSYDSFRPGSPAFLQSIGSISQFDAFFAQASAGTTITQ